MNQAQANARTRAIEARTKMIPLLLELDKFTEAEIDDGKADSLIVELARLKAEKREADKAEVRERQLAEIVGNWEGVDEEEDEAFYLELYDEDITRKGWKETLEDQFSEPATLTDDDVRWLTLRLREAYPRKA